MLRKKKKTENKYAAESNFSIIVKWTETYKLRENKLLTKEIKEFKNKNKLTESHTEENNHHVSHPNIWTCKIKSSNKLFLEFMRPNL